MSRGHAIRLFFGPGETLQLALAKIVDVKIDKQLLFLEEMAGGLRLTMSSGLGGPLGADAAKLTRFEVWRGGEVPPLVRSDGKLAALIEWATRNPTKTMTGAELLSYIERMFELDRER